MESEMSKLPKLRLKMPDGDEEIHDFDEAKSILQGEFRVPRTSKLLTK